MNKKVNIVSEKELIEKIEGFNKSLFMKKDKESWLMEHHHEILNTISRNNNSIFTFITEIEMQDFCCLIQNKYAEELLNTRDCLGAIPLFKKDNDLHVFLMDIKSEQVLDSILKSISNFSETNKKVSMDYLFLKNLSFLRNGEETYFEYFIKKIKELKLDKVELNWTELMANIYYGDFSLLSDEKMIKELKDVYSSKEMEREIFIYTQNLYIAKSISDCIDSMEVLNYIKNKMNEVDLIINQNVEDDKKALLLEIKTNLEKKDIMNSLIKTNDDINLKKKRF